MRQNWDMQFIEVKKWALGPAPYDWSSGILFMWNKKMKIRGCELVRTPQSALSLRAGFMLPCMGVSGVTGVLKPTPVIVGFSEYCGFVPGLFRKQALMLFLRAAVKFLNSWFFSFSLAMKSVWILPVLPHLLIKRSFFTFSYPLNSLLWLNQLLFKKIHP